MLMCVLHCLQDGAEDDMEMDDDDGPMRIVRNYQRHDARWAHCATQGLDNTRRADARACSLLCSTCCVFLF